MTTVIAVVLNSSFAVKKSTSPSPDVVAAKGVGLVVDLVAAAGAGGGVGVMVVVCAAPRALLEDVDVFARGCADAGEFVSRKDG